MDLRDALRLRPGEVVTLVGGGGKTTAMFRLAGELASRMVKRLILDSRVFCDQSLNERMQQRLASLSEVVNTLQETAVKGEVLLGNAPMRAQPTPQARPDPCHRLHMHVTNAVAIFIAGVLAPSMVDTRMSIAPGTHAGIHAVLLRIPTRPWSHGVFAERLTGLLLHIRTPVDDHLTATRQPANDGWPRLVPCAAPTCTVASVATSCAPLVLHPSGGPVWPATPEVSSPSPALDRVTVGVF